MDLSAAVPGVDLSRYDAPVDYDRLVAAVGWVIVRAGNGRVVDPSFADHVAGIDGRVPVGTYWYGLPSRDAHTQALIWAEAVRGAGRRFDLGHWLDLEDQSTTAVVTTYWLAEMLDDTDGAGLGRVGLYCSPSWWQNRVGAVLDPGPRLWWVPRYPWQDRNGGPVGARPPDEPSRWPAYVSMRAGGRDLAPAPRDGATAIWQWCSIGNGTAVGTPRPGALDCDLMAVDVFARLTGAAPDLVTPPVVTTPTTTEPQEDDEMMTIARRARPDGEEQDPRLYKTNGVWKERIYGDTPEAAQQAWDLACDDFGKPHGFLVDMDAGRINRMRDVGPDPV